MSNKSGPSRRKFLTTGLVAGVTATSARAGDPAITDVQPWAQALGKGVDERGYGMPSPHEAHVLRKSVPWLTAEDTSSINFTPLHQLDGIITPNGLAFERHHSGVAEVNPSEYRLMINGLVDTPMVFTLQDLMRFPRHNKVYFLECTANSGMEWRGPQLNGVQFTHGMMHNVMYT
ncbi:MAG: molybdopterin-dependent oxidoreductase, partial [Rhodobacteraceae bacterium]|nr:molybdopterin-dependent oxidoreductase [Paracoccaceae bacterium]